MKQITEDYVSFETSKLLKEKGFDIPCNCYGAYNGVNLTYRYCITDKYTNWNKHTDERTISCPTLQMAMKWLREVYNICITIYPDKEKGYEAVLYNIKDDVEIVLQSFGIYGTHIFGDSYEQAVEEALLYVLKNLI